MNPIEKFLPDVLKGIRRCESAIIGLDRVPADEVISGADWAPDTNASYCERCGSSRFGSSSECPCPGGTLVTGYGRLVRLTNYEEPMSGWIREMKYRSWESMAESLGRLLGEAIRSSGHFEEASKPLLVPVPMPSGRRLVRGMDHAASLCAGVSRATGFKVFQPLKQKHGRVQAGASFSQRSRKPDPFLISWTGRLRAKSLQGRSVLVIDDVRTTGRTLGLVSRALKRSGASVVGAGVLAVRELPESVVFSRASTGKQPSRM